LQPLRPDAAPPQLWGGFECTVSRVGDRWLDQIERTGHRDRIDDLDLVAGLGIRTLRYPILWEYVAPDRPDRPDWSWTDRRMERMRELGIRPIVGLVHHGAGPRYTSLVDPDFPRKLADYAARVAERYPWAEDWTPINEPLTTARFSGLYGHWHPHGRDVETFARCLHSEIRGTALAMQAVRRVNPKARLIQTEDIGRVFSTPKLAYQAEFENERRWLSYDMLCGRFGPDHPLRWWLAKGLSAAELDMLAEEPCPPDILGFNHYVTSDRFLDQRLERYPVHTHGGNGRDRYADTEAVRVVAEGMAGLEGLLREAWARYGLPMAVTERHLGCTREEQLRWFLEGWQEVCRLRGEGIPVVAVTAWSLLGACGWDSLATAEKGTYEPGVYDLRGGPPRPTAIAGLLKGLATGAGFDHPALDGPGWWRRDDVRLAYPPVSVGSVAPRPVAAPALPPRRKVLITGATGTLGRAYATLCELRGLAYELTDRRTLDIADPASAESILDRVRPWAVINTAGYVRVPQAESEPEQCMRANATGAQVLAEACAAAGVPLVTFSSDLVFDGRLGRAYVEGDAPNPRTVYGRSKAEAERAVTAAHPGALVLRTSAFFGPWDEWNFVLLALRQLGQGREFAARGDQIVSPTYVPDLVHASLDLLIDGEAGIWHLANEGELSWADLAVRAARLGGVKPGGLRIESDPATAGNTALDSARGRMLPDLDHALARWKAECRLL